MDESRCIEFDDSPGLALLACIVDLDSQITAMLIRPQLRMSCRNRHDRQKKLDLGPPLGQARATALTGETARSCKAYEDFFSVWKEADVDLPILREAKQEYEVLVRKNLIRGP